MDNNEFKMLRENLNLSYETLSRLTGEAIEIIRGCELDKSIPSHVARFISKINSIFNLLLHSSIQTIIEQQAYLNFIRYKNDQDFEFADPKLFKILLCNEVHTAFLRKVFDEAKKLNIRLGVVDFNKEDYIYWLNEKGYCHCDKHRGEWVGTIKYTVTLGQKERMEEMFKSSNEKILEMKSMLITVKSFGTDSFMLDKIEAFQNALLYGILELGEGTVSSFNEKKLILAANAVRALFERQAVLYYLYYLVDEIVKNDNVEQQKSELQKLMFGAKGSFKMIESLNILKILNKQKEKMLSETKIELYDELSDLIHPNFNGVFDAYIDLDIENSVFLLGPHDKGKIGLIVLIGLDFGLSLTNIYYNELKNLLQSQGDILIQKYKNVNLTVKI